MPTGIKTLFGLLALFTLAMAITLLLGRMFWDRTTAGAVDTLLTVEAPERAATAASALPEPVARYLARALGPAPGEAPRAARLIQSGEMRIGPDWYGFDGEQWSLLTRPGFVWDARLTVAPILKVLVRDSYLDGHATMRGSLGGFYGLLDAPMSPALAEASLQRYLAEAVWYPQALRPSDRLRWEPIDATRARAVLSDAGIEAALEFRFSEAGDVLGVYAGARYREVDGQYLPTPWEGRFSEHDELEGQRLPLAGEVGWVDQEGYAPYWRARLTAVHAHP